IHADHVAMDSVRAAEEITQHLLRSGRQHIATIGYEQHGTGRQRWRGYLRALEAAGLEPTPGHAAEVKAYRREDGAEAMAALLQSTAPIDAVLCFNDLLALGAMRTLREAGVAIPPRPRGDAHPTGGGRRDPGHDRRRRLRQHRGRAFC